MTNDWLYPLSSKSGYYFLIPQGGKTPDTGPAAFEEMILAGGSKHEWGASKNWRNVGAGDRVWIYYGTADGDLGIVGLAHVERVQAPSSTGGRASLFLNFDFDQSRKLLRRPFSAIKVRKYVPRPIATVWSIPSTLARELVQHVEESGTLRTAMPKRRPSASTIVYQSPARNVTVRRRHDSLMYPLETRLSGVGWNKIDFDVQPKQVDLAMKRKDEIILVEAKTINGSSLQEARQAFAQLAEYTWRFKKKNPRRKELLIPWSLFESEPHAEDIAFLEDHGILVAWASKKAKRLYFGPQTSTRTIVQELSL